MEDNTQNEVTFHGLFENVKEWSERTFGTKEERGGAGALKHMVKEVATELFGYAGAWYERTSLATFVKHGRVVVQLTRAKKLDEYADLLILLIDSAWREGYTAYELIEAGQMKMRKNRARVYAKPKGDDISEHDRSKDDHDEEHGGALHLGCKWCRAREVRAA